MDHKFESHYLYIVQVYMVEKFSKRITTVNYDKDLKKCRHVDIICSRTFI